eukprot:TRINITY_DN25253_c0_g1_i1.p1 TRINITY_DN25253_c0_g1~~TRINITY_DN25253_c0_g1_i1.p1  ORF type:complete len:1104 (-),score=207.29 TRINITY_DN25253_c0_g1_i1:91-3402(-)
MQRVGEPVKTLGRGAFGVATLVKLASGEKRVVKQVALDQMSLENQEASHKEVGVLRQLSHQHIVRYYDAFIEDKSLYIVMEFVDGGDLSVSVRNRKEEQKPYPEDVALKIFGQCLLALSYIHGRLILHRDIKCQNIFLTAAGDAKIGDFGISKVQDTATAVAGTIVGTPSYLAPEICEDAPYGSKVDIWSMGIVLYELLALTSPFQANNVAAVVMKIVTREPPPLAERISEEVRSIVAKTLTKQPDARPSAEELLLNPAIKHALNEQGGAQRELSAHVASMDQFEKIRVLGRGSYGVAILVRQLNDPSKSERVIKTVKLTWLPPEAHQRARDEVQVLRRLAHPHVIAYHDFFVEQDTLHILLEYADGGDLASDLKNRSDPYGESEAMRIFGQCLLALRYIHNKRIIHRDVKSQNVFLTKERGAKLGDFGIAKMMQDTVAEPTEFMGTVAYLAPEVCQSAPYSCKVDIWSVGVVLYELVSLKQPFSASNVVATIFKIVSSTHPPLPEFCSKRVCEVVSLTLQKDAGKRPSAEELLSSPTVAEHVELSASGVAAGRGVAADTSSSLLDDSDVFMSLAGTADLRASDEVVAEEAPQVGDATLGATALLAENVLFDSIDGTPVGERSTVHCSTLGATALLADNLCDSIDGKPLGALPQLQVTMGATAMLSDNLVDTVKGAPALNDAKGATDTQGATALLADHLCDSMRDAASKERQASCARKDTPHDTDKASSRGISGNEVGDADPDIVRLAREVLVGGESKMMDILREVVKLKKEAGLHPTASARAVVELWDDVAHFKRVLSGLQLLESSEEFLARKALVSAIEMREMREEERQYIATLRAESTRFNSSSVRTPTAEESSGAAAITSKRGADKASGNETITTGSQCGDVSADEDAAGDGGDDEEENILRLVKAANEVGGGREMQALVEEVVLLHRQEGLHPSEIAKAIASVWSDLPRAKAALKALELDKYSEEHTARKALVSALESREMKEEELKYSAELASERTGAATAGDRVGADSTNACSAAGNALAAVRLHRRQRNGGADDAVRQSVLRTPVAESSINIDGGRRAYPPQALSPRDTGGMGGLGSSTGSNDPVRIRSKSLWDA